MNGRDRFIAALNNQKADRLPCQVHDWMSYYLKTYLNGMTDYEAYANFGMDPVIYQNPKMIYSEKDLAKWSVKKIDLGTDSDGVRSTRIEITTPEGTMVETRGDNPITGWITKHMIQTKEDFELWNKYFPIPVSVDWTPVREAKNHIGDKGIVRGGFYDFGQGSPWQSFAFMFGTEEIIMTAIDEPDWLHHVLNTLLEKKLRVIELAGKNEMDLIETGGGAGSSTVISPTIHKEFCLPYDQKQHAALHRQGTKAVYHLCGGFMPLLDLVVENGADGLETMTPPIMGGDCIMSECTKRIGDRMFFIGGFDQNAGFEKGNPELVKRMVFDLHKDCPDGGYIVSPSDHFFYGDPKNLQAFVDTAKECTY